MLNLIPQPKKISYGEKRVSLDNFKKCKVSGLNEYVISQIKNRFEDVEICDCGEGVFLELTNGCSLNKLTVEDKSDAYSLEVCERGVRIDALTDSGLFYGVQTLLNLPNELSECEIQDYASIPIRMLHVDLKGYLPHFDVLKDELKIFASYKVNAILLEIEDKYQYKCAPTIAVPGAYTFEQMRELSVLAKNLNIKVVPLLQCMAHVDYITKVKEYASLRDEGNIFNFDPYNKEVKVLWEAMAEEIMECFIEHKEYFHIGADEATLDLQGYSIRVKETLDFVKAKGYQAIMWDDMLRTEKSVTLDGKEIPIRDVLCKDVILMYWVYDYGGEKEGFEYVEKYKNEGHEIWGASGFSGCDNWAGSVPPMEYRAKNSDNWTECAIANDIKCVCSTGWTRIASADCPAEPYESCWATILYSAESMWSGKKADFEEFIKNLYVKFYGQEPDENIVRVLMNINKAEYDFEMARKVEGCDRLRFLCFAAALEKMEREKDLLIKYFQYFDGKLMNRLEDYRYGLIKRKAEELIEKLDKAKVDIEEIFSKFYDKITVEEVIRTRFNLSYKIAKEMLRQIDLTEYC